MSNDHKLLPKHGEQLRLPEAIAENMVTDIVKSQNDITMAIAQTLSITLFNNETKIVTFPCKQCLHDIALQCHDLSELIKGLVDKIERKKDGCGND